MADAAQKPIKLPRTAKGKKPVYFDPVDLPQGKKVFFFGAPNSVSARGEIFPGYTRGETVYENPRAVPINIAVRTVGQPSMIVEPIYVAKVIRDPE